MKKSLFILVPAFFISINTVSAEPNSTSTTTSEIIFASLDTAVNGNQLSHSIDATIIDGKYKGAKLHGKLVTTKSGKDHADKISLRFTSMDMNRHSKPIKISAYAIDVDTAKTALKGKVSPEYLQHNGIILAASLIQSYSNNSNAVQINAGTDIGVLFTSKSST